MHPRPHGAVERLAELLSAVRAVRSAVVVRAVAPLEVARKEGEK
jgi:hypothetical protein